MDEDHGKTMDRRAVIKGGVSAAAVAAVGALGVGGARAAENPYADPAKPGLPKPEMKLDLSRTALVITDPQIDFLSPKGVTWEVVGESVKQHKTVENIGRLLRAAKQANNTVAISQHYYYPYDHRWKFGGPLEQLMHKIGMFDRGSSDHGGASGDVAGYETATKSTCACSPGAVSNSIVPRDRMRAWQAWRRSS